MSITKDSTFAAMAGEKYKVAFCGFIFRAHAGTHCFTAQC